MKKTRFQIIGAFYLAVNGLFLLPAVCMSFWNSVTFYFPLNIYFMAMILYFIFGITFLHLAIYSSFLVYSVLQFVKERKGLMFAVTVLVVVISAAANVLWLLRGRPFTVQ